MRAAALSLILLSGCAAQTTTQVVLVPAPNTCQATEVRPTLFSTAVMGACWNERGEMVNAQWIEGEAVVGVPLAVLSAGASLGSAYILGSKIVKAAKSIPTDYSVDGHLSGAVDVNGFVDIGDGTVSIEQTIVEDSVLDAIESKWEEWLDFVND